MPRGITRRAFLQGAALAALGMVGLPELHWREAWAAGGTTVSRTIVGTGGRYQKLAYGPGEPYLLREDLGTRAQAGRGLRRTSLLYFAQLSDTHIVDAQSPGRVEWLDPFAIGGETPAASAFRPQEMLTPFVLDAMVRQINALALSELSGAPLAFAINTGDTTDNRQFNELRWAIDTLDGGGVRLRSGSFWYEGVQQENRLPYYYHPDDPSVDDYGRRADFPAYPGLVDAGEDGFDARGLLVPWYAVLGNHDGLVQGTLPATDFWEALAVGPFKLIAPPLPLEQRAAFSRDLLRGDPGAVRLFQHWLAVRPEGSVVLVTPDRARRFVSHNEWLREHFNTRGRPVGHGFSQRNLETDTGYYTFDPAPNVHCVVLDSVNRAGGANGSIDAAQFDWLDADLAANAGKITLVFAHHTIATLDNPLAGAADRAPRKLGPDLERLFWQHPNVVAFVNGHTHRNAVVPHRNPDGVHAGFWEITTAAHIDWPQQSRLVELFDNGDGTLSLFATLVDHAAPPDSSGSYTPSRKASISRELAFNDPQHPGREGAGRGTPLDRNVELVSANPLRRGWAEAR